MRRPDFFIVGAPRCGTTAMYKSLREHPDVFMPYRKEPVYFGSDLRKRPPYLDERGYLELFKGATTERRIGEATVWYLYSENAPDEIRAFEPDARIIVMLRNPADMIASMHGHFLFTANEDIADLGDALAAEADRAAGRRIPSTASRPEALQYRWLARYAPHVRRWLDVFGRDRVHVVIYDDLESDPDGTFRRVLEFLEVDPAHAHGFAKVNQNKRPRSRLLQRLTRSRSVNAGLERLPPRLYHLAWRALTGINIRTQERPAMDPGLRRRLADEMAPGVRELGEVLGRDLSAWTRTA